MASRAVPFHSLSDQKAVPEPAVILYDGVCHLCQGFAAFIIERDPKRVFRLGFIQSVSSREKLQEFPALSGMNSVILIEEGKAYTRSSAALRIDRRLSGAWPVFFVFILIPPFIRDAAYDFIARHRYHWFGRNDECPLPPPGIADRFMD